MPSDCISYQKSGYFSKLMNDYLDEKNNLKALYNRFPKLENFLEQIEEKKSNFNQNGNGNRQVLVESLKNQYKNFEISEKTLNNIQLLNEENSFTITTGHQLNLFTGPLYFLYKIISTINLCEQLKKEYPNENFVPIYWMATEDHDFEEINHFWFKGNKISWQKKSFGPVGRISTDGLKEVFEKFSSELRLGENATYLKELFEKGYLKHSNLADATRFIANEIFKEKGLVILDGDDKNLKKMFVPYAKEELVNQTSSEEVLKTNKLLSEYKIQVNPREINLFYIEDNLRERIVFEDNTYKVLNTKYTFSKSEILAELENNPEKFSPNVILRPLYQEVILPNLCYIGGGGELAYWLELKSNFEANNVTFPMLLLRNSVLIAKQKQVHKADKLELTWADLFSNQQDLISNKTKDLSNFDIDFTSQKEHLKKQFEDLYTIAAKTDKSFIGAVKAQEVKQIKGLENLEKRLLKAEKRVLIATQKQAQKADKLEMTWVDLFIKQQDLIANKTKDLSNFDIDFTSQKEHLKKQFEDLYTIAAKTDKSFIGAVKAQEVKQIKGLENLEKRLLKAEKRVLAEKLERITYLQNELFPKQSLQERKANFSEYYLEFGQELLDKLFEELKPLENEFNVLVL